MTNQNLDPESIYPSHHVLFLLWKLSNSEVFSASRDLGNSDPEALIGLCDLLNRADIGYSFKHPSKNGDEPLTDSKTTKVSSDDLKDFASWGYKIGELVIEKKSEVQDLLNSILDSFEKGRIVNECPLPQNPESVQSCRLHSLKDHLDVLNERCLSKTVEAGSIVLGDLYNSFNPQGLTIYNFLLAILWLESKEVLNIKNWSYTGINRVADAGYPFGYYECGDEYVGEHVIDFNVLKQGYFESDIKPKVDLSPIDLSEVTLYWINGSTLELRFKGGRSPVRKSYSELGLVNKKTHEDRYTFPGQIFLDVFEKLEDDVFNGELKLNPKYHASRHQIISACNGVFKEYFCVNFSKKPFTLRGDLLNVNISCKVVGPELS